MLDQRTAPCAALLLRLTLGALFIAHLYWKFAIRGFDAWWDGLHAAGYPTFVVIYVLCAEFAGALLLIPGIFTRWVCLLTFPLMVGHTSGSAGTAFTSRRPAPSCRSCGDSRSSCRPCSAMARMR